MKRSFQLLVIIFIFSLFLIPQISHANEVHRVAPDESLYIIAQSYGVHVEEIINLNSLQNPDIIYVGQALIIAKEKKVDTYIVQPGDTLNKVAILFRVSPSLLAEKNNIQDLNFLYIGQALTIPQIASYPQPPQWEESFDYTVSQLARMFQGTLYFRGASYTNRIALTFDDGPDGKYTPQVLDVLKSYQVPATFFLIGNRAEKHPEIVERIIAEGHVVGNHSWSHPDLRKISKERLHSEILRTEQVLQKITGLKTALIRPPYGFLSLPVLEEMKKMNYKVINWSVDSVDWRDQNVDQILKNTLPDVREESILLFHSAGGEGQSMAATVEVLPELIETLRLMGYSFVTVDDLLGIPAYN